MNDKLKVAFWVLASTLLIGWTAYQSWHWFFTEKSPVVNHWVLVQPEVKQSTLKVVSGPSNDARLQDASRVQFTAKVQ